MCVWAGGGAGVSGPAVRAEQAGHGGSAAPRAGTRRVGCVARKSPVVVSRVKAAARPPPRVAATMVALLYSAYPLATRRDPACSAASSPPAPDRRPSSLSALFLVSPMSCETHWTTLIALNHR